MVMVMVRGLVLYDLLLEDALGKRTANQNRRQLRAMRLPHYTNFG
jgi:hypothetical protein